MNTSLLAAEGLSLLLMLAAATAPAVWQFIRSRRS